MIQAPGVAGLRVRDGACGRRSPDGRVGKAGSGSTSLRDFGVSEMKETLSVVGGEEGKTGIMRKAQSWDRIVSSTPPGAQGGAWLPHSVGQWCPAWISGDAHHIHGQTCRLRTVLPTFLQETMGDAALNSGVSSEGADPTARLPAEQGGGSGRDPEPHVLTALKWGPPPAF